MLFRSGNILRSSTRSDFDHGNYTSLEWVRPDGSAAELLSGWNFDVSAHFMDPHYDGITRNVNAFYVAANDASCDLFRVTYRTFENEKTTVYVDMETGEIHDEAGYGEGGSYSPVTGGINARYSWDKKNIREKANPDRIVADLSGGGGAERIFWDEIHDEYWVSTENGYYYVLDNSFQRIREPVQLPGKLYDLSPFGVIAYEESGGLGMYDASGKQLYTFPSADPVGFIAGNFNLNTGEALTLTLGGK